jgi:LysR family transcriptional regulator, regulator of abg operon
MRRLSTGRVMKFNQLKALLAVAKAGSIQEAARLMHLTQPALSKNLLRN